MGGSVVELKIGNIFQSECQTLVNPVNCAGIMGKGLALEFKRRFPAMFAEYVERCKQGDVQLGRPYLSNEQAFPKIINFPTKNHWRSKSRLADIRSGLIYLCAHYQAWDISSLAIPALGCGLGGLSWRDCIVEMHYVLSKLEIKVEIYVPTGFSLEQTVQIIAEHF